ncbi:MAG: hypothetical protein Q9218_006192 [Villophora microphyllina]
MENAQIIAAEFSNLSQTHRVLPDHDRQQPWLQSVQDPWSPQYPISGLDATFPNDANSVGLEHWPIGHPEWPPGGQVSATLAENEALPVSIVNGPIIEHFPNNPPSSLDQSPTTPSHNASQSPASLTPLQSDHASNLSDYLNREPTVTRRLVHVVLTDHPPSVRYHELRIPLPKSSHVWAAATEDERRSLQWSEPAGREKALFCFLMSDFMDPSQRRYLHYRLTEADYHLTLCALQTNIWEVAWEAHGCERKNTSLREPVDACIKHLDVWRANTEKDCLLRQKYFSQSAAPPESDYSPLVLILWHLFALTLHAPIRLLQGQGCCAECRAGTAPAAQRNRAHLRAWATSANARIAVWNAAQICRIVTRESDRTTSANCFLFDSLIVGAMMKSGVVICAYAYHTRACPICTGGPPIDLVDIFGAKDDDDRLVRWKGTGEGLADWVPLSIPVCQCKVGVLAKYLRQGLVRDQSADREFMSFLGGLGKR